MSMPSILEFKPFEFNIVPGIIKPPLLKLPFIIILFYKFFPFKPFSFFLLLIRRLSLILVIRFLNQCFRLNQRCL